MSSSSAALTPSQIDLQAFLLHGAYASITVQNQILKGGLGGSTRSDPMARLAGIALGATGAHVLLAGNADGASQRRAAKITAATSAVLSGLALHQIAGAHLLELYVFTTARGAVSMRVLAPFHREHLGIGRSQV